MSDIANEMLHKMGCSNHGCTIRNQRGGVGTNAICQCGRYWNWMDWQRFLGWNQTRVYGLQDELTTLRARVEELETERECVWAKRIEQPDDANVPIYLTGCGRSFTQALNKPDRPCWCGGKVRVEKGDE